MPPEPADPPSYGQRNNKLAHAYAGGSNEHNLASPQSLYSPETIKGRHGVVAVGDHRDDEGALA